jgi:hypothetical protein
MPARTAVDGSRPVRAATVRVIVPITAPSGFRGGSNRAQPRSSARAENEAENGRHRSVWQPIAVTALVNAPQRGPQQQVVHCRERRGKMRFQEIELAVQIEPKWQEGRPGIGEWIAQGPIGLPDPLLALALRSPSPVRRDLPA